MQTSDTLTNLYELSKKIYIYIPSTFAMSKKIQFTTHKINRMKKLAKILGISALLGCNMTLCAQDAVDEKGKDNFLKRAFRDMKESAKLQRQIDKANYQATKLESKAFFQEQKRMSNPKVRSAAERERQLNELEAAKQRVEAAKAKVENAKSK